MAKPAKKASGKKSPKRSRGWVRANQQRQARAIQLAQPKLLTIEVRLTSGPITEEYCQANPICSRVIAIRSDQTLNDLHCAIYDAFDRDEEHLYEFQFGKRPQDPRGKRYGISMENGFTMPGMPETFDANATTLHELELALGREFYYWIDFGDDWWHKLKVLQIDDAIPDGNHPRVTERIGASPPQYPNYDDEEYEEEEEYTDDAGKLTNEGEETDEASPR